MEYRKKTFRGAKIEDCILDFENMRKTAEQQARTASDEFRKRLYDGMALTYQTVVNRLVNDFDYILEMNSMENSLQKWINDFERMATSCLEQAKNPSDLSSVPERIRDEINPEKLKGLFDGMATGYKMIASQIELILVLGTNKNELEDVLKVIKEQLTKKSSDFSELLQGDLDNFKNGFYTGIKSSYISAITHMRL